VSEAIARSLESLRRGALREAGWPLLARWREMRTPALADALDRLLVLQTARGAFPVPALSTFDNAWRIPEAHPYFDAEPSEPRSTWPLVMHHFHAGMPSWPKDAAARIVAHGDPRAAGFIEQRLLGTFPAARAELARSLPPGAPLAQRELEALATLVADIEQARPDDALAAAPRFAGRHLVDHVHRAVAFAPGFGELALLLEAPRFADGRLVEVGVAARPGILRALYVHPRLRPLPGVAFFGDDGWGSTEPPPGRGEQWTGKEARAAAVALLTHPALASLDRVGMLPLLLVQELAATRAMFDWREVTLSVSADDSPEAWGEALVALGLRRLAVLRVWALANPAPIARLLAHRGLASLEEIQVGAGLEAADAWVSAVGPTVRRLELQDARWTLRLARGDDGLWALDAALSRRWEIYDAEWQDAPTPGADLVAWLRATGDGWLSSIRVGGLAEIDSPEPFIEAARRQRALRDLFVEDPATGAVLRIPLDPA
jgi:hypothetical protein